MATRILNCCNQAKWSTLILSAVDVAAGFDQSHSLRGCNGTKRVSRPNNANKSDQRGQARQFYLMWIS